MLRLNVDAALAVPVFLKMICSSPRVGTVNFGVFFGVKEQRGNLCPPLTFGFVSALAGVEGAMRLYGCLIGKSGSTIDGSNLLSFFFY